MSLKAKLEQAFTSVLKASTELPSAFQVTIPGVSGVQEYTIYEGHSSRIKRAPYVVCAANEGAEEEPLGSGNRFFTVTVSVHGQAEMPEEEGLDDDGNATGDPVPTPQAQQANAQAIFGILKVDNLAAQLSEAVSDFTVYDPVIDTGENPDLRGRQFVDSIMFRVYCCGADIS